MKKILVIEDNHDIRENICEILELSNYETVHAPNGKIGIKIAKSESPDLIICDIMMPEVDGYGVLNALNQESLTSKIPFIFLTAKSEKADFRKGLSLGADDYITKPFTEEELLQAVEMRLKKFESFKHSITSPHTTSTSERSFSPVDLDVLLDLENREVKKFKKKDFLYNVGQRPSHLYYLKKGAIKTYRIHEDGKELITDIHKPNSYFGYYALLKEISYLDYGEFIEPSEVILIPKNDFLNLIYNNMDIAQQFMKRLTNDIVEKEEQLLHMAYATLRQRVARTLCELYSKFKNENNEAVITLTREEISKYIGTARESFIRIMSDLKNLGVLEIIEGDIVIKNIKKLEALQ
ncbi:MAG: response regulator [Chitinophagales bacterium]|nr:response regulator [Chitinophagales bacterium]